MRGFSLPGVRGVLAILLCACAVPPAGPAPMPAPAGRPPLRAPGPHSPRLASYELVASLDAAAHRITATETLTWKHTGVAPVDRLPLHLYLNAFKNERSIFLRESRGQHRRARMSANGWGWIEVTSVRSAGVDLVTTLPGGDDETVLEVLLPSPVPPGQTVKLELAFTAQLPEVFARTGWKGDFTMVGQWFPKVGVLDVDPAAGTQTWHCEPFHLNSEFYADFGTYDVVLDVPETHVVAATGVLVEATAQPGGRRRLVYRAEDVHDFAFAADPRFHVLSGKADGDIDVHVVHRPEQAPFARRHLDAAIRTLELYGRWFGPYPYTQLTVVDPPAAAADGAGGMEYPMLVTTSGSAWYARPGVHEPELVTVHEVGHNWFQGVLASNEVEEAWLDEGVNQYVNGLVMEEWKGTSTSLLDAFGLRAPYFEGIRVQVDPEVLTTPIATPSYRFPDFSTYATATYSKTAAALRTLERRVGRERFLAALGVYARRFAFRHPRGEDFFQVLRAELGPEVQGWLDAAFRGTGEVDFELPTVRTRRDRPPRGVFGTGDERKIVGPEEAPAGDDWLSELFVHNVGPVRSPVEVELIFDDGSRVRYPWDGEGPGHWIEHRGPRQLTGAVVDPDGRVLLEHDVADNHVRLKPRTGPAWRAAARIGFWEQTLLQVVGL